MITLIIFKIMAQNPGILNLFQVFFDKSSCLNVLTKLNFGLGNLKISGGALERDYSLYVPGSSSVFLFPWQDLRNLLTFDWFKLNVVCKEQPWICRSFPPA